MKPHYEKGSSMNAMVRRSVNVICTEVDDVVVILDIESGMFRQLNRTAAQIWNELEQPLTLPDLCSRLEARFAIDSEACAAEVSAFVDELAGCGLVAID